MIVLFQLRKVFGKFTQTDRDKVKNYERKVLTFPGLVTTLISLLVYLGVVILQLEINKHPGYQIDPYWQLGKSLANNLADILLVVGIGTLFLEYFGFVKYTRERIRDVLIDDDYLDILTPAKKTELHAKLQKDLYYSDLPETESDSLYNVVMTEVAPLIRDYYYKEYIMSVDCDITDDGLYIKKKIFKRTKVSQLKPEPRSLGVILTSYLCKIEGRKDEEVFKVKSLKFNGKDAKIRLIYEGIKDGTYNKKVLVNCDHLKFEDQATIEIEYETLVPIDDCFFTNRVNKSCLHYCIHFNFDPHKIRVAGRGFGFMEYGVKERMTIRKDMNGIVIRYINWILPGDGTCFTILRKES